MICSWFNSWVAEAMRVKFLAQVNNGSKKAPTGDQTWNLEITRQIPWLCATAYHKN